MTSNQEALEKMSSSSLLFMNANTSITVNIPGIASYLTIIQNTHTILYNTKTQQESNRKGDTVSKNVQRTALITQALDINHRVVAYATNVNNNSLLGVMNYSESKLKKCSDLKLVTNCQVIRDNANGNIAALATYGVTPAMLTTLQAAITAFNHTAQKSRILATDTSEATVTIGVLLNTLKTNWAKIDTLVKMVKMSHPSFYDEYLKVRKVISQGRSSLAMKVQVVNAETGMPEANVSLTLAPYDGMQKSVVAGKIKDIVKKTAPGGGCNYKSLADGRYMLTAHKQGLKKDVHIIDVVSGEMTGVMIQLERDIQTV